MQVKNEEILEAITVVKLSVEWADKVVERVQDTCPHTGIAEASYVASNWYSHAKPPTRICLVCGMTETNWTHKVLIESSGLTPRGIDRDVINRMRLGKDVGID